MLSREDLIIRLQAKIEAIVEKELQARKTYFKPENKALRGGK